MTALPVPTPTPSPAPTARVYVAQPGDTLRSIAKQFDTTIEGLIALNSISDPDLIRVNQSLVIPGPGGDESEANASDEPILNPTPNQTIVHEPSPTSPTPTLKATLVGQRTLLTSIGGTFPKREGNWEMSVAEAWRTTEVAEASDPDPTFVVIRVEVIYLKTGIGDFELATFELHDQAGRHIGKFDKDISRLAAIRHDDISPADSIEAGMSSGLTIVFADVPVDQSLIVFRFDSNRLWPGSVSFPLEPADLTMSAGGTTAPDEPAIPTAAPSLAIPSVGDIGTSTNWAVTFIAQNRARALGGTFGARAQGEFLILTLRLRNIGQRSFPITSFDFSLTTPNGIEYSPSSDGSLALLGDTSGPEVLFLSEEVHPGLSSDVRVVFDVPPGISELVLDVQGIKFRIAD